MTLTEMDWLSPLQISSVVQPDETVLYHIRKKNPLGWYIELSKWYKVLGTWLRQLESQLKMAWWNKEQVATPTGWNVWRWVPPLPF